MPDSQLYPWNLYLINNVEDIVDFLGLKLYNFDHSNMFTNIRNAQINLVEKPQFKIISFKN